MDPFATLGIPPKFDVDLAALDKTHRELSRALHPDKFVSALPTERRAAAARAADANEALRVLRDPVRRAEALFARAGIAVGERNEPPPSPDLLMDVMEKREALSSARRANDLEAVRALAREVEALEQQALAALSAGFAAPDLRPLLPRLGELRFYRRLLEEAGEALSEAP